VVASSQKEALAFADKAANELRKVPGATSIKLTSEDGNPEINVKMDREKMNSLGLNVATVGMGMQVAFSGNDDSKFTIGDREYDINIRYDEIGRRSIEDVKQLEFVTSTGNRIKLSQFADVAF